jgi:hypothetical protein
MPRGWRERGSRRHRRDDGWSLGPSPTPLDEPVPGCLPSTIGARPRKRRVALGRENERNPSLTMGEVEFMF